MMKISVDKLMDLYIDTLQKCGINLLAMDDDTIEYNIFEEFDIGANSFLHQNTLLKLRQENLITDEIFKKSSQLRKKFLDIQQTEQWNVESVKNSKKWREILELSDEIKSMLNQ